MSREKQQTGKTVEIELQLMGPNTPAITSTPTLKKQSFNDTLHQHDGYLFGAALIGALAGTAYGMGVAHSFLLIMPPLAIPYFIIGAAAAALVGVAIVAIKHYMFCAATAAPEQTNPAPTAATMSGTFSTPHADERITQATDPEEAQQPEEFCPRSR